MKATTSSQRPRVEELFSELYRSLVQKTDRRFSRLFVGQWALGILFALTLSPETWTGNQPTIHLHVYAAVFLGGILAALPCYLIWMQPGATLNRFVVATAQIGFSILFIHLTGGRVETHFHLFGSLAFLAYYQDMRVLVLATALTAVDHLTRGTLWPQSVYGVLYASPWRTLEHTAWVVFEDVILYFSMKSALRSKWEVCVKQARIEELLHESQQKIQAQQQALVSAAKLSALGEMAGGVAHEINNPLAIIRNCAEQLQEEVAHPAPDAQGIREMIQTLVRTSDRIAKIVQGLRSFSRDASRDPFQSVSLEALITGSLGLCSERFRSHGIALRYGALDPALSFEGRETEISQVLINLLNNAHDAVENYSEPWVEVSSRDLGDSLEIRVTDSGAGIAPELERRIFEPFFSTKEVGKGTGMGLSISLGIARNHGGDLTLDRASPNTCFVVRLPKKQTARARAAVVA